MTRKQKEQLITEALEEANEFPMSFTEMSDDELDELFNKCIYDEYKNWNVRNKWYEYELNGQIFEWDTDKLDKNVTKHGIHFKEAADAFMDEDTFIIADKDHSLQEQHLVVLGMSYLENVLFICFVEREANIIRLFSARKASKTQEII